VIDGEREKQAYGRRDKDKEKSTDENAMIIIYTTNSRLMSENINEK